MVLVLNNSTTTIKNKLEKYGLTLHLALNWQSSQFLLKFRMPLAGRPFSKFTTARYTKLKLQNKRNLPDPRCTHSLIKMWNKSQYKISLLNFYIPCISLSNSLVLVLFQRSLNFGPWDLRKNPDQNDPWWSLNRHTNFPFFR